MTMSDDDRRDEIRAGIAQFAPSTNLADNLRRIRSMAEDAGRAGVDLLVFPELSGTGWGASPEENAALAQPVDGELIEQIVEISDTADVGVVVGFYEPSDNDSPLPYNTLAAVVPRRGVVATHRKTHMYDAWGYRETDQAQAGVGDLGIFDLREMRIGLMNCYEVRFPERAFLLAAAGCDLLTVSAAWPRGPHKEDHWSINVRARAMENQTWVAASSATGDDLIGRSLLADPLGVACAGCDERSEQWIAVSASTARRDHARRTLPVHRQRAERYGR